MSACARLLRSLSIGLIVFSGWTAIPDDSAWGQRRGARGGGGAQRAQAGQRARSHDFQRTRSAAPQSLRQARSQGAPANRQSYAANRQGAAANRDFQQGADRRTDRTVDRNVDRTRNVNRNVDRSAYAGGYYGGHHGDWDWDDDWDDDGDFGGGFVAGALTTAAIGSIVNSVPPSCQTVMVNGMAYQQCGSTWYEPQYFGTSVQYVVVSPPQ